MPDRIIGMLKKVGLPTRFMLVALGLAISIAVPLFQLYRSESAKISITESELRWCAYIQPVLPLIRAVQGHELAWEKGWVAGHADRSEEVRTWNQIQRYSTQLAIINQGQKSSLGLQQRWKNIEIEIRQVKKFPSLRNPDQEQELHSSIVTALWSLYESASDRAGLGADRNRETTRELRAVRVEMIQLLSRVNEIQQATVGQALGVHGSDFWRADIIEAAESSNWRDIASIRNAISPIADHTRRQSTLLLLRAQLIALRRDGDKLTTAARSLSAANPAARHSIFTAAGRVSRDVGHLFRLTVGHLQQTLRVRLGHLRLTLLLNIGLVSCLAAVVGLIFYTMYRSLLRALGKKSLAERDLQQLTDLYATLSQTNQLVAHRCPQEQLFKDVCKIITESAGFQLAFIAVITSRSKQSRLHNWAGSASGYLTAIWNPQQQMLPAGLQPIETAITAQKPAIIQNFKAMAFDTPWGYALEKFGLASAAAFPLVRKGLNFGAMVVYSSRTEAFTGRAAEVLSEIATSLSFAIEDADRESLRRAAEQALRDSEARYHLVMEAAGDAIVLMESDGRIIEVNRRALALLGYTREEMFALRGQQLFPPDGQGDAITRYNRIITTGETVDSTTTITRKDLRSFPVEAVESRVEMQGKYMVLSIFRDISDRKIAEERIHYLAYHDSLTGLPNRTLLIDRLEQAIREAHRRNTMAGVVFIDLDNFKSVNDTLGHDFGDELLQGAAMRIRSALRTEDTVARLGGDEFIVLIKEPRSPGDVNLVAQKIIQSMSVPFVISGHTFHISCSIGMSIYPRDGVDCGVLLRTADEALYQVKKEGKNRAAFHTPEMHAAAIEHIRLENDLREALRKNQFVLQFQPQVHLQSGKIIGSEALIRWHHPERGMVSPAKFIPLAEEKGLILEIGEWILHEACAQNRKWQLAGIPIVPVAVNLSALQCREPGLPEIVRRALRDTGLEPGMLELEITESTLMAQTESLRSRMLEIKDCGIRFSLDDFGTGYSSLSYLTRFPIDTLKIDSSFIRDMIDDPKDLAVVDTIVNLADNLQLRTIAEGVEKIEQITLLKLLGCNSMQGYYFSKPLPADEMAKMLLGDIRLPTSQSSPPHTVAV